jgi:hypothetical protein
MHFELAEETIQKISLDQLMFDAGIPVGPVGGTQARGGDVAWCKKSILPLSRRFWGYRGTLDATLVISWQPWHLKRERDFHRIFRIPSVEPRALSNSSLD